MAWVGTARDLARAQGPRFAAGPKGIPGGQGGSRWRRSRRGFVSSGGRPTETRALRVPRGGASPPPEARFAPKGRALSGAPMDGAISGRPQSDARKGTARGRFGPARTRARPRLGRLMAMEAGCRLPLGGDASAPSRRRLGAALDLLNKQRPTRRHHP